MEQKGEIIILNGTSSSGKSLISQELQNLSENPYLAMGLDTFLPLIAPKFISVEQTLQQEMYDNKEDLDDTLQEKVKNLDVSGGKLSNSGFQMVVDQEGKTSFSCGPTGWNLLSGMHHAFAAMARAGNYLTLAEVISEPLLYGYCQALKGLRVYLVGVMCPLEELERREAERPDRAAGTARMQIDKIHIPGEYDVTLHTDKNSAKECAQILHEYVENNPPQVFDQLVERYANYELGDYPIRLI